MFDSHNPAGGERVFINGRFFCVDKSVHKASFFWDWMHVSGNVISSLGHADDESLRQLKSRGVATQDMKGSVVLPSFFDGHLHLLMLGQSLQKLDLGPCGNLDEIRCKIREYSKSHPDLPRILCRGWMRSMTDGQATASMLDDLDDRPIFIDSTDLHSTWCNTAALHDIKADSLEDIPGGIIDRDESGRPKGLLSEAANINLVWPHIARVAPLEHKIAALKTAIDSYTALGYTGMTDMAMDDNAWEAILALKKLEPQLPLRLAAYWLILPGSDQNLRLAQVDRAIALNKQFNNSTSPDLRIVGIKIICDGIVDGCTAALCEPYSHNGISPDPIWTADMLRPVVKKADEAGLQVALHAIGDATVRLAIDTIEQCCTRGNRARIEHLELTSPEDAKRLGRLGITASIQPVHSDPAILRAWPRLLGGHRLQRAFAYKDFADGNALLAIGSDSPTASWAPLRNLYVATTRKSVKEPDADDAPVNPHFALDLCEAIAGATSGSAYSCFADKRTGSLKPGLQADFVVVDMEYDAEKLLEAKVRETWFGGRKVFEC